MMKFFCKNCWWFQAVTCFSKMLRHGCLIGSKIRLWTYFIPLTLSWRGCLSYRNQSIDLFCTSMDWFLYDKDLRHERVNNVMVTILGRFVNASYYVGNQNLLQILGIQYPESSSEEGNFSMWQWNHKASWRWWFTLMMRKTSSVIGLTFLMWPL